MKINIPSDVKLILSLLNDYSLEAYVVGGCVRDSLLGLTPKDWDICTNALPINIVELFEGKGYKVVPTGLKHGTITIIMNKSHYEVTTYRIDGEFSDCKSPENASFTDSLMEDLSRRDFTINAMAYHDEIGLVDYFNGKQDLENGIINTVGNPDERFNEDALRMLRAVRISTKLGYTIDEGTTKSIRRNRNLIKSVSVERIREELCKILISDDPTYGIEMLRHLGLLDSILPELQRCYGFEQRNPNHDKDVYFHILSVINHSPNILEVRLAALLHDIGKPNTFSIGEEGMGHFYRHHLESEEIARQILTRLKFDNKTIDNVCILVREHMSRYESIRTKNIKKLMNRVGVENLNNLFELQIADIKGSGNKNGIDRILSAKIECERILIEKQPLSVRDLAINGKDLIELGVPQGRRVGEILNDLLEIVLEKPEINQRCDLIEIVKSMGM